jgi:RNA polymerase sigma factor (sigma-70 family)
MGHSEMRQDGSNLALFMAHRRQLIKYASGFLNDRNWAEDLVQEAFLRFDATMGAKLLDEPIAYLYRIVRNLALDGHRQRAREARYMVSDTGIAVDSLADDRPSPEAEALHRDQLRVLQAALAELPERTRLALEMHRFGGYKLRQIAERLGISNALAHSLVAEAVEHCRQRLRRVS